MALQADLLSLSHLEPQQIGRWRELAAGALEPNPFYEPDYLVPLARGLGQIDKVALLAVSKNGSWIACAPVYRRPGWRRIRVPLPATSVWGGHRLYSRLGIPLILGSSADEAARALLTSLVRTPGSFFTEFQWLDEGGAVYQALRRAMAKTRLFALCGQRSERALLRRRLQCDYLEQTMNGKHRNQLRRNGRKLAEQLGEELTIVDRSDDRTAVAKLIELEGQSRLAPEGEVLTSNPGHARFFEEMCASFAAQGRLELLTLEAGHQTVAILTRILAGRGLFGVKMAYDERYAQFSPGIQLEVGAMSVFHEHHRADWIDCCADETSQTFNRLYPDRRVFVRLAAIDPTMRGLAVEPARRALRRVREHAASPHQGPGRESHADDPGDQ